jgi:hypothetical protein
MAHSTANHFDKAYNALLACAKLRRQLYSARVASEQQPSRTRAQVTPQLLIDEITHLLSQAASAIDANDQATLGATLGDVVNDLVFLIERQPQQRLTRSMRTQLSGLKPLASPQG